jgi:hypothetical protein
MARAIGKGGVGRRAIDTLRRAAGIFQRKQDWRLTTEGDQPAKAALERIRHRAERAAEATLVASMARGAKCRLVGEQPACMSVDVQSARFTPCGELICLEIRADDADPIGTNALFSGLSSLLPSLIGEGQSVTIRHHGADRRITVSRVPGNSDDLNLVRHTPSYPTSTEGAA